MYLDSKTQIITAIIRRVSGIMKGREKAGWTCSREINNLQKAEVKRVKRRDKKPYFTQPFT